METKICPSCGAEAPIVATRCKVCFHEFTDGRKRNTGFVVLVVSLAVMAIVGAGVMYYVAFHQSVKQNVVVDEETQSVVWTTVRADGTDADRVSFDRIERVDFTIGGSSAMWEVAVILEGGERRLLSASDEENLAGYAIQVARIIGKPLEENRKVRGFSKEWEKAAIESQTR
ncbi:MAG: hypothetical protein JXB39_03795 [Deltaproteobacteria bacterium]|nr:hypothetical protein [Deltaproteobacteria bacterium]